MWLGLEEAKPEGCCMNIVSSSSPRRKTLLTSNCLIDQLRERAMVKITHRVVCLTTRLKVSLCQDQRFYESL